MKPVTEKLRKDDLCDFVLYELNVRNFSAEGTFQAILPHIDYLKSLGVNMIWFMPVHPIGSIKRKGTYGSPYSIQNFYEVNPDFGAKEDFKNLIAGIHEAGMKVILDLVTNHTSWDHPWIAEHTSWYILDSNGNVLAPNADWTDVAQLNYSNPDLRAEMENVMKYWVEEFGVDGYRCDMAELVPADFWKNAIASLRKLKPVFMLAESENPSMAEAGFDAIYGFEMYHAVKKIWREESPAATLIGVYSAEQQRFGDTLLPLRFITNHDEYSWQPVPQIMYGSIEGAFAAFAFMMCLNGLPLVFNGQESAFSENMNLFEKYFVGANANHAVTAHYRKLLAAYHAFPAFCRGEIEWLSGNDRVLVFKKSSSKNQLLCLFNVSRFSSSIPMPHHNFEKHAIDIFSGHSFKLSENIELHAYEFHILQFA